MRKLLFLLLCTVSMYGQAEFDAGIQITGGQTTTSTVDKILSQEANGVVNYIPALSLPLSTVNISALQKKADLSTGLIKNGLITINADPTKYNISAGIGIISNFDDPENPVSTLVSFSATTGKTPTYLNTGNITYVAINSAGVIVESASQFTVTQRRDLIILGAVIHSNLSTINVVNNISAPTNAVGNQLHDFMEAIGALNITGNKYTANGANLQLNKSAGSIFKFGVNFATNWKDPHEMSQTSGTALTFRYRIQNGTEGSDRINLDPALYDLGNILTAVPNNKFTIQTVTIFQTGLTRIQYGQTIYDDLASAQNAIFTRDYVVENNILMNGVTRAYIILKNTTTSLQNTSDARIVEAQKFGGVASGGVALTFANIVTALGYTPENIANKQNTLVEDGTGVKYPTVDAVNTLTGIPYNSNLYTNESYLYGDSITTGSGALPKSVYGWNNIVPQKLGTSNTNYAIGGTTLVYFTPGDKSGIERLTEITPLYDSNKRVYISGIGVNDIGGGSYNATNFRNAYYQLIDRLVITQGWPANKIFLFVPYTTQAGSSDLDALVLDIATVKGVNFIPVREAMVAGGGAALVPTDGLHPTNLGHKIIAETIYNFISGTKYDYTQFHQDISITGNITVGKGIIGGTVTNGLELSGFVPLTGVNDSKITAFSKFNFNKDINFSGNITGTGSGVKTTPKYVKIGAEFVSTALTSSNLQLYTFNGTGIGTSTLDGLGLFSVAGPSGGIITSYQQHYFKDNIRLNQTAGALTTPKFLDFGGGVYADAPSTYANAFIKFFNGTYIGIDATQGFTFGSSVGTTSRFTFKNKVFVNESIEISDTNGAVTTPFSLRAGSSTYVAAAITSANTSFRGYSGSGMGFSSVDGLALIANGLADRISLKNPIFVNGAINSTSNATIGTSLTGSQITPSFIDLGSSFANTPTTTSNLKLKIWTGSGVGLDTTNGMTLLSTAGANGGTISSLSSHAFASSVYFSAVPTTSAGTYDFLTRNTSTGVVEKITSASVAPTASPTFTGTPTAPTATAGTNNTQIATTAFVLANFPTVQTEKTGSYTLTLTDANTYIPFNISAVYNLTIPTNAAVAFPIGSKIEIAVVAGSGSLTIIGAGVTLLGIPYPFYIGDNLTLTKTNTNTWVIGNISKSTPTFSQTVETYGTSRSIWSRGGGGFVFEDGATGTVKGSSGIKFQTFLNGNNNTFDGGHFNFVPINPIGSNTNSDVVSVINSIVTFAPTSGNAQARMINLEPTINQTGGASGIIRALYIKPTLTSATDFRAIEVTAGKSIFQEVIANNVVRLKNYTVATLPTGTQGDTAYVTDATAPTYLGALTGGGSVVCPVFYDGVSWKSH